MDDEQIPACSGHYSVYHHIRKVFRRSLLFPHVSGGEVVSVCVRPFIFLSLCVNDSSKANVICSSKTLRKAYILFIAASRKDTFAARASVAHMVLTRSQSRAARSPAQAARYAACRRAHDAIRRELHTQARRTRRQRLTPAQREAQNSANAAAMRRARAARSDDERAAQNSANAAAMRRAREARAELQTRALNRENVAHSRRRLACLHEQLDAARMREHVAGVLRGYRGRPEQRRERELCIELAPIAGEDDADYMERVRLIRRRHLRWRSHSQVDPCTLPAREACQYCGSLMWPGEGTACCRGGRYILPAEHFHVPEELRRLYQNRHVQFYARYRAALA